MGFEVARGRTIVNSENSEVREGLRMGKTEIEGEESSYYLVHGLSVAVVKVKEVLG